MPVSLRVSELSNIQVSELTDSDLLLITDTEASASKKLQLSTFKNYLFSGNSFGSFSDVDLSSGATDGQFLRYDAATQRWNAGDISLSSLGDLQDVDLVSTAPQTGQTLIWDGSKFEPGTIDLSPLWTLLGEAVGDTDLGNFTGSIDLDNMNVRTALQTLSNAITANKNELDGDIESLEVSTTSSFNSASDARDLISGRIDTLETFLDDQLASDMWLFSDQSAFPSASDNHGRVVHSHADGAMFYSHGGQWIQLSTQASVDLLQTTIDNLDIDISPETLNSINELAGALQDDPNIISALQTKDTQLEGQITSLSASTATDQGTQDARLTQLEADVLAIGQAGAPAQLDTINELAATLAKLVPLPPTTFDGMSLIVNTNAGTARLCTGFTDRTGGTSPYSAGDSILRNTDGSITTDKINDVGPGDSGTINVKMSVNSYDVTTTMASGTQILDFMGLKITDNKDASLSTRDSDIPAGFYQTYDIQLVNAHLQHNTNGLHYVQFTHDTYATAKGYFYEDESTVGAPQLSVSSISMPTSPDYNYSSGIPHYSNSTDNEFGYTLTAQNLSGDMYNNHILATSSQTGAFSHQGSKTYTDFGGTNPPAKDFGVGVDKTTDVVQYPRNLHTSITNNQFSNWTMSTPYGSDSVRPSIAGTFLVMGDTSRTNVMDEDNILISNVGSGAGNAYRVGGGTGDNPVPTYSTWDPTSTPQAHEAIVVGGKLKHDTSDYSDGYFPVGPDLSSRSPDPQYFEVEIRRSDVSQFNITYNGSCDGCWVCMPENTNWTTSLSGTNGWADMFQAYKGSGVPTTSEPGCSSGGLMDNNGGTFTCVFGTESSSNDLNNRILVRWKLTSGQQINSMSFS